MSGEYNYKHCLMVSRSFYCSDRVYISAVSIKGWGYGVGGWRGSGSNRKVSPSLIAVSAPLWSHLSTHINQASLPCVSPIASITARILPTATNGRCDKIPALCPCAPHKPCTPGPDALHTQPSTDPPPPPPLQVSVGV